MAEVASKQVYNETHTQKPSKKENPDEKIKERRKW